QWIPVDPELGGRLPTEEDGKSCGYSYDVTCSNGVYGTYVEEGVFRSRVVELHDNGRLLAWKGHRLPDPYVPPEPEKRVNIEPLYYIRINDEPNELYWSCNLEHGAGWREHLDHNTLFTMEELKEQMEKMHKACSPKCVSVLIHPVSVEQPERRYWK